MTQPTSVRVVTISATYGAGGSVIGPKVAAELALPFLDRAIPAKVAERLSVPIESALSHDERTQSRFWSALALSGPVAGPPEMSMATVDVGSEDRFREQTEAVIKAAADGDGGVILGRAAAVFLGPRADTLRVRLDGSVERRIAQAIALGDGDEATVRRRQRDLDRTWTAYAKRFYRADPNDHRYIDLLLDSTALSIDTCVDLIVRAARQTLAR